MYVYVFFFFLEKVKILSCEFQLPGTNSHCVSTAVAFLVFLICLVDQMILLIGIVTSVLPIIDSFVFEEKPGGLQSIGLQISWDMVELLNKQFSQ